MRDSNTFLLRLGARQKMFFGIQAFRGSITSTGQLLCLAHLHFSSHAMFSLLLAISDDVVDLLMSLIYVSMDMATYWEWTSRINEVKIIIVLMDFTR